MDFMERLTAFMGPDDALFLIDDFLSDGDREGLVEYIEDLERRRYCSPDVIEEVLTVAGLEKIQS